MAVVAIGAALSAAGAQPPAPGADRLRDLTSRWEAPRLSLLWGYRNLYNACVVRVPDQRYRWRMWLFGWAAGDSDPGYAGADAVYCARSRDLSAWEVYAGDGRWDAAMRPERWVPVLTAGSRPYDNVHNGDPSVVLHEGTYHMAFSSVGFEEREVNDGRRTFVVSCIMGAISSDGIHWRKSEAPILVWRDERANGWALHDGRIGDPPPAYFGGYHRPCLLRDGGRWRLWFDYFHPGTFVSMGLAECAGDFLDPSAWRVLRAGDRPLLRDWPNPCVVRAGGRYLAFSDAPYYPPEMGGDGRQLTLAESADGIRWTVLGHVRPEGLASSHVPEALVVRERRADWLYLFYSWKPARLPGHVWDYRYKAIRWMRMPLGSPEGGRPGTWPDGVP